MKDVVTTIYEKFVYCLTHMYIAVGAAWTNVLTCTFEMLNIFQDALNKVMPLGSHCYSEKHPPIQSSYSRNWRTSSGRLSEIAGKKLEVFGDSQHVGLNITLHCSELFLAGRIPVLFTTFSSCGDIDFDVLTCSFTVIEPTLSLVPNMEGSSYKSRAPCYGWRILQLLKGSFPFTPGFVYFWLDGKSRPIPSPTHTALFFLLPKTRNEAIARTTAQGYVVGLIGIR